MDGGGGGRALRFGSQRSGCVIGRYSHVVLYSAPWMYVTGVKCGFPHTENATVLGCDGGETWNSGLIAGGGMLGAL